MEYKFTNPKKCQLFSAVESTKKNVQNFRSAFCTEPEQPTSPGGITEPTEGPAPGEQDTIPGEPKEPEEEVESKWHNILCICSSFYIQLILEKKCW